MSQAVEQKTNPIASHTCTVINQGAIELNKVYNMDCLLGMASITDKSIDMILCDLPYQTTSNEWDIVIPFEPLWKQYERIIKDNGAIILTGSQPFTTDLINSKRDLFRYCMVWHKHRPSGSQLAKSRPLKYHEDVIVFYKKQPIYNPQMSWGKMQKKAGFSGQSSTNYVSKTETIRYNSDLYYPKSVIEVRGCHNMTGKNHPTEKPVELFEYLIKTYTNEGETVLDNCMGSGTTAIACINTNRNYIGFEKEEKYFRSTERRIKKHVPQKNLFDVKDGHWFD